MILINLLPHREAARKRRKEAFQATMFASFLVGLAIAGAVYWWFQMMITNQQERNAFLQGEIKVLEEQIKEIATIEDEIAALRARQKAVEDLQSDRNLPVHLLNELVRQVPEGAYVTSIKQTEQVIAMQGFAQSNERVSEFLRNLQDSPLFAKQPQLEQTLAQEVPLSNKSKSRAYGFKMVLTLKKPEKPESQKAVSGKPAQSPASASASK